MSDNAMKKVSEDDGWNSRVFPGGDADISPVGKTGRALAEVISSEAQRGDHKTAGEPKSSEWASTLLLVQEACESIRISEERVEALERELEQAAINSRDDLKQMLVRFQSAQEEIKNANARAKAFEARALEAENWLGRLNEAIVDGFSRRLSADESDAE